MKVRHVMIMLAASLILPTACRQKRIEDGGPCSYSTVNYPATIIAIFEEDSLWNDIWFELNREGDIDTLLYSQEFSGYISSEELKQRNFRIGDTLCYQHKQITSGHCTPDIFVLTREKYTTGH